MKAKIEGLTAQGSGVYQDNKGRTYVADRKNRTLYAINKDSQKKLSFYQQRHLVPMLLLVTFGFYVNWYVGIGLALGSIVVLEYLYSQVFLKSLVKYENIDIPTEPTLTDKMADSPRKRIISILVMSSLLPILLIINLVAAIKLSGGLFTDTNNLILLTVSVALIVYASRYIYASIMALRRQ